MWKIKLFCEVSHVWILGGTTWKSVAKLEGDWKREKWKNSVVVSPKSPQQARGCPTCSRLYFCFSQAAQAQAPPSENHFSNIGQTPHSAGDGGERSRLVEAASEKWVLCRAVPCQRCAGCQCEKSIAVRWSVVVGRATGMIRLNCIQSDFTSCAMHY